MSIYYMYVCIIKIAYGNIVLEYKTLYVHNIVLLSHLIIIIIIQYY